MTWHLEKATAAAFKIIMDMSKTNVLQWLESNSASDESCKNKQQPHTLFCITAKLGKGKHYLCYGGGNGRETN